MDPKHMIAGFSVIGAVAGMAALVTLPFVGPETTGTDQPARDDYELCLKTDAPFFEGATATCYDRRGLMALAEAPVTDGSGAPVSVVLTHPTDMTTGDAISRTCSVYFDLKREGWYALSSSDQRREAFFIRACGALALMLEAREPKVVHFTEGSPDMSDMTRFLNNVSFGIAPAAADVESDPIRLELDGDDDASGGDAPEDVAVASESPASVSIAGEAGEWRAARGDQLVVMQELALADFDGDGVGEFLVFVRAGPRDGTAIFYAVGLLEKDSPGSQLSFRLSDYAS